MKVVIVGGVAGGATAAARIRRLDEKAEIVVFERPGYISYANCCLRSYIASRILEGNGFTAYNFSGGFRFYDAVVNDRALIESAYSCGMDQ